MKMSLVGENKQTGENSVLTDLVSKGCQIKYRSQKMNLQGMDSRWDRLPF